jgi:hypothetical protein
MPVIDIFILGFAGISLLVTLTTAPMSAKLSADEVTDLERSAKALELYLQDKKDHDKHCPFLTWEQPALDVYKKTLESQLPKGCKE